MSAPIVFDRALLRGRRMRAQAGYTDFDFLRREAAARMMERLAEIRRRFPLAVELGARDGQVADLLQAAGAVDSLICVDTGPSAEADVVADEDFSPLKPGAIDAVFSLLSLHWVNDLPGALIQIREALSPDGLFMAGLLGGATLADLRAAAMQAELEIYGGASPRVSPAIELREAAGLLQRAGFALPVADVDRIDVDYESVFGLFRDLRGMGATNALIERPRRPVGRAYFARLAEIYAERTARPDGRVTARFDLIWLTGWAPGANQQKALNPGAAERRLSDALGAPEQSAGQSVGEG